MPRYRLSRPAQVDLAGILLESARQWGIEGRRRYAAVLAAAMGDAASDPQGPVTRDRAELSTGLRSLHSRHARAAAPGTKVKRPVHVIYYRAIGPGLIEIVRVLHERMEPGRHLGSEDRS